MSREIKFRAFHKSSKKFIYSDWKYGVVSFWDNVCNDFTNEHEDPQEYTGLKDKNRKEIYEGDILHNILSLYCKAEVIFKNGSFGRHVKNNIEDSFYPLAYPVSNSSKLSELQVIGNIYENPELIKQL